MTRLARRSLAASDRTAASPAVRSRRLGKASVFLAVLAPVFVYATSGGEVAALSAVLLASSASGVPGIDVDRKLAAYRERAEAMHRSAFEVGAVSYADVLRATYEPGAVDSAVLQWKQQWRSEHASSTVYMADYSTTDVPAVLTRVVPAANASLDSVLIGSYIADTHRIAIGGAAGLSALFHESGHSLQRMAMLDRASKHRLEGKAHPHANPAAGSEEDDLSARRLAYLTAQDEFEVRLQDLNRFNALLVTGRPVMGVEDAVRALAALGVPLTFEEVEVVFRIDGRELSPETFSTLVGVGVIHSSAARLAFDDAYELGMMRTLALRSGPAQWRTLLQKIILETPGHI